MRKRKPIGIKRANKLMHDMGLPTPEDIFSINPVRFFPIERLFIGPNDRGFKPGYYERKRHMPDIPVIDFRLIKGSNASCGCCHQPIKPREGMSFGRPFGYGRVPPINVCATCVSLAMSLLVSAREGLI
jgi:hypothetical protein